ncbi:hypothetical protein V6N13_049925 [Hibiscus sabdariffa]|uniref:Protein kinase domain-containing protein n=1 Tax=Hibiscus sabdariffa TaxID=183260 RepID=A0ABR2QVR4_9ROSI
MEFFTEYGEANMHKILEVIRKRSYGVVCAALDMHTGEIVAIKKMLPPSKGEFKDIFVVFELMKPFVLAVSCGPNVYIDNSNMDILLNIGYAPAIDIWSIGCIFAEVVTGKPLFPGKIIVHQFESITDHFRTRSAETTGSSLMQIR